MGILVDGHEDEVLLEEIHIPRPVPHRIVTRPGPDIRVFPYVGLRIMLRERRGLIFRKRTVYNFSFELGTKPK